LLSTLRKKRGSLPLSYGVAKYPPYDLTINLKKPSGYIQSSCNYESNYKGNVTRGDQWDDDESGPSTYSKPFEEWVEGYLDRMARKLRGEPGLDFV
jgi:hypothetical protein